MKKGVLVLEDGTRFEGVSFGSERNVIGEVVFNTAMNGYPESLTDPSYMRQILVETYPMIGNYGMPQDARDVNGLSTEYESDHIWVEGLICADYSEHFSHWDAKCSLSDKLVAEGVPALSGIDTRALTKRLREQGSMKGTILIEGVSEQPTDPRSEEDNLVALASIKEPITYGSGAKRIAMLDCGTKNNILRQLIRPEVTLIRLPWDYDLTTLRYDALFISNGPGNPKQCGKAIEQIRTTFNDEKPIMGLCMGNQLMALAAGADIYKLKYGHRSHNQPVMECATERCFITSQNHSYAVNNDTLPADWQCSYINLNDHTNEGLQHKHKPFFSVQFHPEACGGPTDTLFLFDQFIDSVVNR